MARQRTVTARRPASERLMDETIKKAPDQGDQGLLFSKYLRGR